MAPLIALIVTSLAARGVGALGVPYVDGWPASVALGLAAMFAMTGITHFVPAERRLGLIAIVPPAIPRPDLVVTITGVLEFLGALGLLIPPAWGPWRALAAGALALLLVVMFPANVYAAGARRDQHAPNTPLLPRTLMQLCFVAASVFVALAS